MSDAVEAILGLSVGFSYFQFFSSPGHTFHIDRVFPGFVKKVRLFKRRVYKATPTIKASRFQFSPNIRINLRSRNIWIHHWIIMGAALSVLEYKTAFGTLLFFKSLCAAGVFHGFLYKDRFKIFPKKVK